MLIRLLLLLGAVAPYALADVEFTTPKAGATVAGGSTFKVEWKDSGSEPKLSSLQTYQLFLCAGGNDDPNLLQAPIVTQGEFSTGNSASGTVQLNFGGTDKNAYFLKMISSATGGTVINYSSRFSLSGMTGTFPANVAEAVKGITGTDGPASQNNIKDNANAGAAGAAGGFSVAYTLQTGLTRYAPMQGKPGTKITAKQASAQYPTSAVNLAKTFLPTPVQVTTMTMSGTYALASSIENTASPAPGPMNAMQKYLNRWRD